APLRAAATAADTPADPPPITNTWVSALTGVERGSSSMKHRLLDLACGIWLAHCVRSILPSPVGQSHPARWAYSSCHKPCAICHKPEWGVLLLECESLSCSRLSAVNL